MRWDLLHDWPPHSLHIFVSVSPKKPRHILICLYCFLNSDCSVSSLAKILEVWVKFKNSSWIIFFFKVFKDIYLQFILNVLHNLTLHVLLVYKAWQISWVLFYLPDLTKKNPTMKSHFDYCRLKGIFQLLDLGSIST